MRGSCPGDTQIGTVGDRIFCRVLGYDLEPINQWAPLWHANHCVVTMLRMARRQSADLPLPNRR
jgi:hypothetical protein